MTCQSVERRHVSLHCLPLASGGANDEPAQPGRGEGGRGLLELSITLPDLLVGEEGPTARGASTVSQLANSRRR